MFFSKEVIIKIANHLAHITETSYSTLTKKYYFLVFFLRHYFFRNFLKSRKCKFLEVKIIFKGRPDVMERVAIYLEANMNLMY